MGNSEDLDNKNGNNYEMIYKLIIIGEKSVGKTTLIQQFVQCPDQTAISKFIGFCQTKQIQLKINEQQFRIKLVIWDLPDSPQFSLSHQMYYNGVHGILLGLDLTQLQTCFNLKEWIAETHRCGLAEVPIVLWGNKSDLTEERKVHQEHLDFMKSELKITDFIETSALKGDNVASLFELIATRISEKIDL
jgi:small GTP-binding protein